MDCLESLDDPGEMDIETFFGLFLDFSLEHFRLVRGDLLVYPMKKFCMSLSAALLHYRLSYVIHAMQWQNA